MTSNPTNIYMTSSTSYGGEIELEDFNTHTPNKRRIRNQADAINLPEALKKERQKREYMARYKNMPLEQLRKMKIVSNTDGRPSDTLTDEKWQREFEVRKLFVHPNDQKHTKMNGPYSREPGVWNDKSDAGYPGPTNWQSYCSYMNDVLRNIRSGQTDYCYFIYQILDLLKFHYDELKTKYCDGYWEVWLERRG